MSWAFVAVAFVFIPSMSFGSSSCHRSGTKTGKGLGHLPVAVASSLLSMSSLHGCARTGTGTLSHRSYSHDYGELGRGHGDETGMEMCHCRQAVALGVEGGSRVRGGRRRSSELPSTCWVVAQGGRRVRTRTYRRRCVVAPWVCGRSSKTRQVAPSSLPPSCESSRCVVGVVALGY